MAHFSVEELQKIAVEVTSDFCNHGTPLSVGLAKQASERELNSDQIKRAVEATNTLAYLKSIEDSDRTGEFPLADYDEIVKYASLPEGPTMLNGVVTDKSVGAGEPLIPPSLDEDTVKEASMLGFEMPAMTKQAGMKFLIKEAATNKRALEDAESRAVNLFIDLTKQAAVLKKDEFAVYGMSLAAKDEQFTKLACLVFGPDSAPQRVDYVSDVPMHRDWKSSFEKAASLSAMLTDAEQTLAEIEKRTGLDKEASLMMDAGMAVGRAAKKVVTAPFGWAGNKVARGFNAGVDQIATKAQTGFASTSLGKSIGIQPGKLKPSTVATMSNAKRNVAIATVAGGAGFDALSFQPHNDPSKNKNGDVWSALN